MIIYELGMGCKRFGELERAIPKITRKVLTQQLKRLEKNGIIERKVFAEIPPKVEYTLTKVGMSLFPIFDVLYKWGDSHINYLKASATSKYT